MVSTSDINALGNDAVIRQEGAGNGLSLTRPPSGSVGGRSGYSFGRSQIDLGQGEKVLLDDFEKFLRNQNESVGLSAADVNKIMRHIGHSGRDSVIDHFTPQIDKALRTADGQAFVAQEDGINLRALDNTLNSAVRAAKQNPVGAGGLGDEHFQPAIVAEIAQYLNRFGLDIKFLKRFLRGQPTPLGQLHGTLTQSQLENYIASTKYFRNNPRQFRRFLKTAKEAARAWAQSHRGAGSISPMDGNFSGLDSRLDWAALDRATRLIARLGAAPVRRRGGEAVEHVPQAGGHKAATPGVSGGYLARAQGFSPGAAVGPAGGAVHSRAGHDAGGTKGKGVQHRSRGGAARSQAVARAAVGDAARELIQARAEAQSGSEFDPASFAALGGPPHLAVAMATGVGQAEYMTQADAARLPTWMAAGMADVAGPGAAMAAAEGGHAPSWAVPMWMQRQEELTYSPEPP